MTQHYNQDSLMSLLQNSIYKTIMCLQLNCFQTPKESETEF